MKDLHIPWIVKKKEKEPNQDARSHNSKEENELLDEAHYRFQIAQSEKVDFEGRPLHSKWEDYDKMYRSRQWKEPVPAYKSQPVLNFSFGLVESVVPRLTDSIPEVLVTARRDERNEELAKMLTHGQSYLWYVNRMQKKMPSAVRTALKLGTSIFKTFWDPDFYEDMGEVRHTVVHPMNFFNDPRAYEVEDMEYCFVRVPKPLEFFVRRWENKGHLVVPDLARSETESLGASGSSGKEHEAHLTEYWFRDEYGNLCVMYFSGDVVLDIFGGKYSNPSNPQPLYRHNRFPFSKFVDYPGDKAFWGFGELEVVEILQRLINSYEAQIIDNTRLMSNAEWLVNKYLSGLTEDDAWLFDNRPGNVIWTHNGGVEKLKGAPIPPHIPEHLERLIFAMEQILGIHDVVQGRRPVGVRSAAAIIALQESANVRVRQKANHLQDALVDAADMANWLMLEHYDEPRKVRLMGTSVPTTLRVREALERRMTDMGVAAGIIEPGMSPGMLPPEQMDRIMEELRFPEFDVEVKVGPSVPYSQALLYEQAKEFYQLGIIDRQAVLEATNFPGREQILARLAAGEQRAIEIEVGERIGERTFGRQQGIPQFGRRR